MLEQQTDEPMIGVPKMQQLGDYPPGGDPVSRYFFYLRKGVSILLIVLVVSGVFIGLVAQVYSGYWFFWILAPGWAFVYFSWLVIMSRYEQRLASLPYDERERIMFGSDIQRGIRRAKFTAVILIGLHVVMVAGLFQMALDGPAG